MEAVLAALVAYVLGAIPFSYLLGRLRGKNLLREGSGNPGALNLYRTTGSLSLGGLGLLLDVGKGYAATMAAAALGYPWIGPFFAVLGHNWSPFLRFRGGRGLAVLYGASLFLQPTFLLVWVVLWLLFYILSGYIAVGAMGATLLTPPVHLQIFGPPDTGLVLATVPVWMKYAEKARLLAKGRLPRHFWRVRS